jgi:predicted phage terminase large subunit-like protein
VPKESIFWVDERTEEGELAWPERFPEKIVKELQRDKGPYAWYGQYQQTPEPRGGSIIKRDFWQLWEADKYPSFEFILGSLDTAYTAKEENDPSALTIWGVFRDENNNPKMMLMYAWQDRLEFHDLFQRVIDTCTLSPVPKEHPRFPVDRLLIEAKASGQSVGQELHRLVRGTGSLGIELIDPKRYGDKVARVQSIQHLFADNMIYAPNKTWATMMINQAAIFPKGSHDDLVDSMSQALRYLRDAGFALRRDEQSSETEQSMLYRSPNENLPLYQV